MLFRCEKKFDGGKMKFPPDNKKNLNLTVTQNVQFFFLESNKTGCCEMITVPLPPGGPGPPKHKKKFRIWCFFLL